jgi:2-polyprenyl-6-methoxyphenol hydroxylase-like FAD-dependent oxidoreductase
LFVDARSLPADAEVTADICIVGCGPAGIALALALDGLPLRVVVLESGGLKHEPAANDLSATEDGLRFGGVERLDSTRRFGGNASAWAVQTARASRGIRLVPFTAADLEPRPWLPHSGWPIDMDDLAPVLPRRAGHLRASTRGLRGHGVGGARVPPA